MYLVISGAICFGIVLGWVTHRTIRKSQAGVGLSDIATILGSLGGAVITGLFGPPSGELFASYSIGLAIGFFLYLILASTVLKNSKWAGD